MGLKAIGYAQTIIGYIGGLFSPASLDPRQWLFSQTEPDEVDDKSTNLIDANYVGSPSVVLSGSEYLPVAGLGDLSGDSFDVEVLWTCPAVVPATKDLFAQSAGTGTGRAGLRILSTGEIRTFIGGIDTQIAPAGTVQALQDYKFNLRYDITEGTLALFVNDEMQAPVSRTAESADGDFQLARGHSGTATVISGEMTRSNLKTGENILDVVIIAGQSNAKGQSGEVAPSGYDDDFYHRFGYTLDDAGVVSDDDGYLTEISGNWGSELSIGKLFQAEGRKIAVFKGCEGSTSLGVDWKVGGGMYDEFLSQWGDSVDAWELKGYTVNPVAFVWIHGESDSNTEAYADAYTTNYDAMRAGMETTGSIDADLPTIITRTPLKEEALRTYQTTVWASQDVIGARAGNNLVDTLDLALRVSDETHFTGASQITLGERVHALISLSADARTTEFDFTCSEASGADEYDISGNGRHSVWAVGGGGTSALRAGTQDVYHYAIFNGYSLYEHASSDDMYVPYGSDGSALTITPPSGYTKTSDHTGGYLHNGAPTSIEQANGNEATLGISDLFYEVDETTEKTVTWADILAWVSYSDDYTWLKFAEVGGRCYLSDSIIIDIAADASAHGSMVSWKGGAGCGGGTAPF